MLDLVNVLHMQIQTLQKNELVLGIIFQGFLVGTDSVLFCTFLVCSYCSSSWCLIRYELPKPSFDFESCLTLMKLKTQLIQLPTFTLSTALLVLRT